MMGAVIAALSTRFGMKAITFSAVVIVIAFSIAQPVISAEGKLDFMFPSDLSSANREAMHRQRTTRDRYCRLDSGCEKGRPDYGRKFDAFALIPVDIPTAVAGHLIITMAMELLTVSARAFASQSCRPSPRSEVERASQAFSSEICELPGFAGKASFVA
jgi:hypothetical protein